MAGEVRVGTSGFMYDHWREVFYPPDVPKSRWLAHYVEEFDTVELNVTFYRVPSEKTFDSWRVRAPEGFCYAVKLNRYITHRKRLRGVADELRSFVDKARRLGKLLGPILVQLPPSWRADAELLNKFLGHCPRTLRWAVEFRNRGCLCDEMYDVLRRHGAALCIHDLIEKHPREVTADFVYLRFHGAGEKYGGDYPARALGAAARWVRGLLAEGLDVFAYFNNDAHGYAVLNALDLKRRVEGG